MIARVFFTGEGVTLATDSVKLLGDLNSASLFCSLEDHMLDEMGQTAFLRPLVTGAHIDPDAHSHRASVGHSLADDSGPITQGGLIEIVRHSFVLPRPPFGLGGSSRRDRLPGP